MKKICSIILFVCTCFNFSIGTVAYNQKDFINYVALGDSIALGFQPDEVNSKNIGYADLFKKYLEESFEKVNFESYAASGQTSEKMLKQIKDIDLSSADLITITIGSNDLLKPFSKIICDSLDCKSEDETKKALKDLITSIKNYNILAFIKIYFIINNILKNGELFDNCIKNFEKNFNDIIEIIKEKNPNAKIIVTNFYNPYAFMECFGLKSLTDFTNNIIKKINEKIEKLSKNKNFNLVDISFIGDDKNYLNVILDSDNFMIDPHPNQKGHKKIYENIINTIKIK